MAALTYDDFKQRVNIQDLLVDAGYTLNRRDGLRYPSYVRLGSDGRRVHGDKFIVTANGLCCFQPPERKNYNVISFIKEHPTLFAEYQAGMDKDRLVNLVCNRLLNQPVERKAEFVGKPEAKPFDLGEYETQRFDCEDMETQKRFYPFFKYRGISLSTQKVFADHFFLATKERTDGRRYTNLSFPLSTTAWPGKQIVGLEERSRPNAEGKTIYKGMAAGSNASEGLWIARIEDHHSYRGFRKSLSEAKNVYWFESAYDAMAFYQLKRRELEDSIKYYKDVQSQGIYRGDNELRKLEKEKQELGNAVFVSTGGSPSRGQFASMLRETPNATHTLCFDRDRAGQMFALNFAMQQAGRVFTSHISPSGKLVMTDLTKNFKRYELNLSEPNDLKLTENFNRLCGILGMKQSCLYLPADNPYKDYNDQLLQKPLLADEQNVKMTR